MDGLRLTGLCIRVNHAKYGILFSAFVEGEGTLITDKDEEGNVLEFLTTDEILRQLMKFGFYITYDVKSNLPYNQLQFLRKWLDLGFDKITRIALECTDVNGNKVWRPQIVIFKSGCDPDLLIFDCKIIRKEFNELMMRNEAVNVTSTLNMRWDWVKYMANIQDILDENADVRPDPEPEPEPEPQPEPEPEPDDEPGGD